MYIQLDGQIISYEKSGEGRPIILLHGNGEDHHIFDPLLPQLSASNTVYAMDTRGHGESATPKEYHYADMAKDVINFINALEIEKPVLIGFSDGAIIATLVAISQSSLLEGIILCGGNLSPKGVTGKCMRQIKKDYKKTKNPLAKLMMDEPNISVKDLARINIPTLVCVGSKDIIKFKETKSIAYGITQAKLHVFRGEDHGSYLKKPELFIPVAEEYL